MNPTGLNGPLTPPTKAELEVLLDQRARLEMEFRYARHAQLVISVDGKCKFARAYTYGEAGYPCTQLHHKFVVASVAKWLTCMAVLHYFTDPSAGIEGMRQQLASVYLPEAFNLLPRGGFFDTTSLEDLISFRSGWNVELSLLAASKNLVGGNYAEPGDMRLYFAFAPGWSFDDLYSAAPGSTQIYNNEDWIALGEIVSARASAPPGSPPSQPDFKKCQQTMLKFWGDGADIFAAPIPKDVNDAFDRGVSPQHSYSPGWKSDWVNEQTSILGPNVYTGENEWWLGTDWAMTMPMLARILDGYLEDPAPPVKKLLDPSHALLMSKGPPGNEGKLLGIDVAGDVTIGGGTYRRLFKNGGEDGAVALAALYWKLSGTGPQSISIALAMDGARATFGSMSADIMLPTINNLLFWGHWHDGLNLYELLF